MTGFEISALDEPTLQTVRASGTDVSSNPIVASAAEGGEPLRCCLRNARPDEQIILFGYEPALPAGPYREVGPVFAHGEPCGGPALNDGYPPDWLGRRQILRAYDARGWIHPASCEHDGTDPAAAIAAVLAHPDVALVHSRNVVYGCYMFAITRVAEL
jgi:hypothetical protein